MTIITSPYHTIVWDDEQASDVSEGAECAVYTSTQLDDDQVAKLPLYCGDHNPYDSHEDWVNLYIDNAIKAFDMGVGPRVLGFILSPKDESILGYVTEMVRTTDDIVNDILDYLEPAYKGASTQEKEDIYNWQANLSDEPGEAVHSFDTVEHRMAPEVKGFIAELEIIMDSLITFIDMGICDMHMFNVGLLDGAPITIDHGPYSCLQNL